MPKAMERALKKEYGANSDIPFKIMNKLGYMHGSKVTKKGKKADKETTKKAAKKLLKKVK